MTVHEINVRRENNAFVLSAERRHQLSGMSGIQQCWDNGKLVSEGALEFYRPEKIEMVFDKAEDAVTAIGRLLRDGT